MFIDEILNSIDKINDSMYDAELAVSSALSDSYTKHAILLEHGVDTTDDYIFMEASSGKSFISNIWEKIKKFFKMLKYALARIVNAIKRLLGKKTKSVEQIAEECGITPKKDARQNISNLKNVLSSPGETSTTCYAGKGMTYRSYKELQEIFKNFIVKFDNKGYFYLHENETGMWWYRDIEVREKKRSRSAEVKNMKSIEQVGDKTSVVTLIIKKNLQEMYFKYVNTVIDWIGGTKTKKDVQSTQNEYVRYAIRENIENILDIPIKYNDFIDFQKKFNDLFERFEKIRLDENTGFDHDDSENKVMIEVFCISMIQMAMSANTLSNNLMQSWVLDSKYTGAADTFEKMSYFAEKCVKAGLPPKYIVNALIKISGKKILGTKSPQVGQTRIVFFPTDESVVYKFAYNVMGHTSNINEITLSKYFDSIGLSHYLASASDDSGGDAYGLKMERGMPIGSVSINKLEELVKLVNDQPNTKYKVIDIHEKNVAMGKNNNYILIDYGFIIKKK